MNISGCFPQTAVIFVLAGPFSSLTLSESTGILGFQAFVLFCTFSVCSFSPYFLHSVGASPSD